MSESQSKGSVTIGKQKFKEFETALLDVIGSENTEKVLEVFRSLTGFNERLTARPEGYFRKYNQLKKQKQLAEEERQFMEASRREINYKLMRRLQNSEGCLD